MTGDSSGVLGILFPQVAHRNMARNGPTNFSDRLQLYIARTLFPDSCAARGNLVAIDYVTEALLRHGTMSRYELFVEPSFLSAAEAFTSLGNNGHSPEHRVRITSTLDLPRGVDKYSLTAFFNPSGNFSQPLIIRNNFASQLYPVSILTHGFSLHSMLFDGFLRLLLEGTYPCDSLICTSRASRTALTNILEQISGQFNRTFHTAIKYSARLDVIPLCVDTERFKPASKPLVRRQLKLPKDALILLYVGYISVLKADLLPLLDVFRRLVANNPGRKLLLVIAGARDAVYADTLQKHIKDLSLSQHVRLMPSFPEKTKQALIASADVFVSPGDSIQESFGLTPIEAMACGVPQVVADWDGYRDTVSHGETGFLIPTYWTKCDSDLMDTGNLLGWEFDHLALGQSVAMDVDALHFHLQTIIENDQLRQTMSEHSRQRAKALYSFPVVVRQYEELWSELSFLARGIGSERTGINFERPRYFECFKNHSASVLTSDSVLTQTARVKELSEKDIECLLHPRLTSCRIIDRDLIRFALRVLDGSQGTNGDCALARGTLTFGELVDRLAATFPFHLDYIRRNVMWLIKHGLVRPDIPQPVPVISNRGVAVMDQQD